MSHRAEGRDWIRSARNALIARLDHLQPLTSSARLKLEATQSPSSLPPHHELLREGQIHDDVHIVIEGFACRYKMMRAGARAIVAWLLPGDFCSLALIPHASDYAVATVSACVIARMPRTTLAELSAGNESVARALCWARLADEAIQRQWLANMGRGPAVRQFAHLVCETFARLRIVGCVMGESFNFPFTQEELGDTLGLTSVHVNRVLQQLREEGLLTLHRRMLTIRDLARLERFAEFDPAYLQLRPWSASHHQDGLKIVGECLPQERNRATLSDERVTGFR
jgi:CRP-like cAMP-binding protein